MVVTVEQSWRNFEKSGKITDYLAYVQARQCVEIESVQQENKGDNNFYADHNLGYRHTGETTGR